MPRKLEDVLRSRRSRREAVIRILHCRDDLNNIYVLIKVLENACTALECPQEFHCNASLAALVADRLQDVELGLAEIGKLIRGNL